MSKTSVAKGIKLNSFNDLFGANASDDEIIDIPLGELYAFCKHPFKVIEDEAMTRLVESIKKKGVLSPIIVRKRKDGGYEIVSGHRRAHAAMKAELKVIPAIVRDLSDDEAIIIMVDANIQREEILPSEKAKAYKMKYDAMKNQGLPGNSLQQISEVSGDNYKAVQRYIWLARLNDDLLELVDKKRLGLVQGVSISSLSQEEQKLLYPLIKVMHCKLSSSQAETIKKMSQERKLTEKTLTDYLEMENLDCMLSSFYEGGIDLSGGEWQKIALARADYRNAELLMFDEPTSALDPESEIKFYNTVLDLVDNKTFVIVSHRMAVTKYCNKIFVMENGKITESGSHDELIAKRGIYYDMYRKQIETYDEKVFDMD